MASAGLQILGVVLTLLGWVNALVSCALPMWKALLLAFLTFG
uniref:Uncharacterized protein n=1 Tax=Microcebus murinus TaxID=30608 RepID=A0A8C5VDM1_MICMU